jgi:hypothetical protein
MAMNSKHYLPSGELYKGPVHKMNGELHSGAKHSDASQVLSHSEGKGVKKKKNMRAMLDALKRMGK